MRQTFYIVIGVALAFGLARTADAVDWQFTGATNRTAAVTRTCVARSGTIATEFNSVVPAARRGDFVGEFDSRVPSAVRSVGHNMRSDAAGIMIIFR